MKNASIQITQKNIICDETFRIQSVNLFSVVDSSVGIFEDPITKLTIVDLGTFYGLGGNGTIPDEIKVYRDNVLWKTTTKETGIAPSTSHSEWQLPQTFFFNELPGKYKIVLLTNNIETLVFEFLVMQITSESQKNNDLFNLPPLKQVKDYAIDPGLVKCNFGLDLIFKKINGLPACVFPKTVEKLIERGWATVI